MPLLFNREEAAALLRISVQSLDLYVKSNQIAPTHFGKRVLFTESSLNRFIKRMQKNPRGCRG